MIIIESIISETLVDLTSNDQSRKSIEKHLFSDAITLEVKVNLFSSLNKNGVFGEESKKSSLNSDLKYLQGLRNYIAHSLLDTSREFMDQCDFSFVRYKSFTRKGVLDVDIWYKDKEEQPEKRIYNSMMIIERINRTTENLIKIQELVKNN